MDTMTRQPTFTTDDGAQLVRDQRHTIVSTDGSTFSGVSRGLAVEAGVVYAMFSGVTGDLPAKGKDRWGRIPLTALTSPRPRMFWDA